MIDGLLLSMVNIYLSCCNIPTTAKTSSDCLHPVLTPRPRVPEAEGVPHMLGRWSPACALYRPLSQLLSAALSAESGVTSLTVYVSVCLCLQFYPLTTNSLIISLRHCSSANSVGYFIILY